MWGGGGGNMIFYSPNIFLLVTKDHMQIFKIAAVLLLGYIWINLKFTPKYTMLLSFITYSSRYSSNGKYYNREFLVQLGEREFLLGTSKDLEPDKEGNHIMQRVSMAASLSSTCSWITSISNMFHFNSSKSMTRAALHF